MIFIYKNYCNACSTDIFENSKTKNRKSLIKFGNNELDLCNVNIKFKKFKNMGKKIKKICKVKDFMKHQKKIYVRR